MHCMGVGHFGRACALIPKELEMRARVGLWGNGRRRIVGFTRFVAGVLALTAIGCLPAGAQQGSVGPQWEALVNPYLWIPWIPAGVRPSNTKIPSSSGTIDPGQFIGHLSWVPFMGAAEFRNGPLGVAIDYLHAPVRSGFGTRNILFGGGGVGATIDTGSAMFLYRPFATPDQYVDVGLGVRVWGLGGDVSLNQGLLPPVSVSSGAAWADPLIAVRYHRELGNGFGATAYGDVGGFGLGAHIDWQASATVDYALKPGIDLHGGFRSLNFNAGLENAGLRLNIYGPILAATIRF
jgi:hypothetical protein